MFDEVLSQVRKATTTILFFLKVVIRRKSSDIQLGIFSPSHYYEDFHNIKILSLLFLTTPHHYFLHVTRVKWVTLWVPCRITIFIKCSSKQACKICKWVTRWLTKVNTYIMAMISQRECILFCLTRLSSNEFYTNHFTPLQCTTCMAVY